MSTSRGLRSLKIIYGEGGSSVDPRTTTSTYRKFRLRRGIIIWGDVVPIVHHALYRIVRIEGDSGETYRPGAYLKVYTVHHSSWGVDDHVPGTWMFDYSDDAYLAARSVAYQTAWCGQVELPLLTGVSLELSDLFAMAVRLRKADPRGVVQFNAKIRGMLDQLVASTTHHDRLLEAVGKLATLEQVNVDRLPQQYPVVWCSQDRVEDAIAALQASSHTYGRLGDALRVHNRLAVSIVRGIHDDLDQMVQSEGDFATENRAERLMEYIRIAEGVQARPWTRALAHVAHECRAAAILCNDGQGKQARAVVGKSVRSLKTLLLRDETEQVRTQLGMLNRLNLEPTSAELETLGEELGRIKVSFEANRDDDFELPVLPRIIPAVTNAQQHVIDTRKGRTHRVYLALCDLRQAFQAA